MAYGTPMSDAGGMDDEMSEPSGMPDEGRNEGPPDHGDDTAYLPVSVTGGKKFQPGDEIVLEVVSVDEDGSLEVKYATGKGEEKKPYEDAIDALPG